MESPFPGMDPYLEGNVWTSFHHELASEMTRQLNAQIRPRYVAFPNKYYIQGVPEEVAIIPGRMCPDVSVVKTRARSQSLSGTQVLEAPARMRVRVTIPVPHYHIEIRDIEKRRLVAAIELLSPANKRNPGRKQYLNKRRRILQSSAHLLEIDLHHQGQRMPMQDSYPPGAFFILLSRAQKRPWKEVWPIAIDQSLPTIPVPLLKIDPDVYLNLQDAVKKVYDEGGFDLVLDYRIPPEVELPLEEDAWVEKRIREKLNHK